MTPPTRFGFLDALRGFAMVWMTAFHLGFDLINAGLIQANFYTDPWWTWQRTAILSLFLGCAGAGQALALNQGNSDRHFWKRWSQIAACAALVSLGSVLMFPTSYIYFGVLHGMAVMLLGIRWGARLGKYLWLTGAACIAAQYAGSYALEMRWLSDSWNSKFLNWIGIISTKPITEDYVPLLPWFGVMCFGFAGMQWWLKKAQPDWVATKLAPPKRLKPVRTHLATSLQFLGRWSLSYYMLHQLVLMAGVQMYVWWAT